MTPEQALKVLDDTLQPGVQLNRQGYLIVQGALNVLYELVQKVGQHQKVEQNQGEAALDQSRRAKNDVHRKVHAAAIRRYQSIASYH